MRKCLQDIAVLVLIITICVVIGVVIKHYWDIELMFPCGYLACSIYSFYKAN